VLNAHSPNTPGTPAIERAIDLWSRPSVVVVALVVVAFGAAYAQVVSTLIGQWSSNDTYSFGVLVPFISAYLIWSRRDSLRARAVNPSLLWGGAIVLLAAVMLIAGRVAAIIDVQEISLILMLVGLVALILGFGFLRELWLPLSYLLLMLPIWEVLTDRMHLPSQLFSASIAHRLLVTIGVPVYHDGVFLSLPNITLEVASACSGVSFLIAVIAVGIPQAYLYLNGWIPRTVAIGFAIAIALLSNGLRVAIIGALSYYRLSEAVHGPGHILQGLFVSSFGFVALVAAVGLLARRFPRQAEAVQRPERAPLGPRGSRLVAAGVGATAVLAFLAVYHPNYRPTPHIAPSLRELGSNWRPVPGTVPARFVGGVTTGDLVARAFHHLSGERVELFIGSLTESSPDGGVAYRSVQLPDDVTASRMTLPSLGGASIQVNHVLVRQAGADAEIIYWYEGNGWTTSYARTAKAYASAHLITRLGSAPRLVVAVADRSRRASGRAELLAQFASDVSRALNADGLQSQ
jgi:exosortase